MRGRAEAERVEGGGGRRRRGSNALAYRDQDAKRLPYLLWCGKSNTSKNTLRRICATLDITNHTLTDEGGGEEER